ncbi:hypothetical protein LJK87_18920 [Paenibacillus sp. P25]|nr:hypothetical protein LJK87_18920 [Paenibacillus sp. P25]
MLRGKLRGKFYRKSLILILIITCIPGLITGALIYWFAGGRIEKELVQLHKNQIARRADNLDSQLSNLELSVSHWAFDPKFDYALKETDYLRQFAVTRDLTKTLMLMQGSLPLTKRIELYVDGRQTVHFDPEFSLLPPDSEETAQFRKLLASGKHDVLDEVAVRGAAGSGTGAKDSGLRADPVRRDGNPAGQRAYGGTFESACSV